MWRVGRVMELRDGIAGAALVVAFISLAVAITALRRNTHHNNTMRQLASAAPDIALAGQMNQARQTIASITLKMAEITKGKPDDKLTAKERQQLLELDPVYTQAVESLHKSYDLACQLYLDGSVDRDRFRSLYERDVRKFFEEGTPADKEMLGGITTPYKALRAVYIGWFNKEG